MKSNILQQIIKNILSGEAITLQKLAETAELNRSNLSVIKNDKTGKEVDELTYSKIKKAYPQYFLKESSGPTEAELLLNEIQYRTGKTLEEIAGDIGYSRPYLNNVKLKGGGDRLIDTLREKYADILQNVPHGTYLSGRREQKTSGSGKTLLYYDVNANAATEFTGEILPVNKTEGVLHISDLFKGSQFAIRISGNSMTPNYPSGSIIGIRQIEDKHITPGSVYVIEKAGDLWIKRLFYKDDRRETGVFQCISDNTMVHEAGPRKGRYFYPDFEIDIDAVRKLFKVTGIYKSNELTVIN